MKKITFTVFILCLLILCGSSISVSASEFPRSIWAVLDNFTKAQNQNNLYEVFDYGMQSIDIMEREPDSDLKTEFLAGKYWYMAETAEKLEYYETAYDLYAKYIPYGTAMSWTDGVILASRKLKILNPILEVYYEAKGEHSVYYGAKHEPVSGVYYGAAYDKDDRIGSYDHDTIRKYFPKPESSYLIYLEFGDSVEELSRYKQYFEQARQNDKGVVFAWNTYWDMADIYEYSSYIESTIDYLGNLEIPIYLRFANEMNIGENGGNPEAYVNAFRYVAEIAHTKSNIATVWSPSDLGALTRPFELYYPGDEYVDWVGISLYTIKYFQGIKDHGSETEYLDTYFFTGNHANPILRTSMIIDFMTENNIEKPVMVSEGGVPYYISTEGEDTTEWALTQMRKMYGELIRYYPQIKLINYFNVLMPNENNYYALYKSPALNDLYNQVVSSPIYLEKFGETSSFAYKKLNNVEVSGSINISAVAYYPNSSDLTIKYFLDDVEITELNAPPYEYTITGISDGWHTIRAEIWKFGELLKAREFYFSSVQNISVYYRGEQVDFKDQPPVLMNDTTFVPVRAVFEKMGLTVEYDSDTQTVSMFGDDISISVKINDSYIHKYNQNGDITESLEIPLPAQIINSRTMLPLRAVSQALDCGVSWNGEYRRIDID